MNVLIINGSPHKDGNTAAALAEVAKALNENGVETRIVNIGVELVRGCIACRKCHETGICAFRDSLYDSVVEGAGKCEGIVIGSPVYYAGPNGSLCALLDRVFYSCSHLLKYKPGAAVAVCRRGGASAAFDRLNKYFTINNMPVVSSQYWNSVHGHTKGEALQDLEGLQTMRTLGRNMAWLLHSAHSDSSPHPVAEGERMVTNFIR